MKIAVNYTKKCWIQFLNNQDNVNKYLICVLFFFFFLHKALRNSIFMVYFRMNNSMCCESKFKEKNNHLSIW